MFLGPRVPKATARSEKEEKRENPEGARALTGETEGGIKVEQTATLPVEEGAAIARRAGKVQKTAEPSLARGCRGGTDKERKAHPA